MEQAGHAPCKSAAILPAVYNRIAGAPFPTPATVNVGMRRLASLDDRGHDDELHTCLSHVEAMAHETEFPMPNLKLDHCVIHVSDWEHSNAFYRDVLGAEVAQRGSGSAYRFGQEQFTLHGPGSFPRRSPPCPCNRVAAIGVSRGLDRSATLRHIWHTTA